MSQDSLVNNDINTKRGSNSRAVVLLDQAVVSATNFLTTIIIGNACGADQLGIYAVGFSVVLLAMAVESSLLSTPFTVLAQSDEDETPWSRMGASLANLFLITGSILVVQLAVWMIARLYLPTQYDQIFQVVLIATPCFAARNFARKALLATFNARWLLILDCVACSSQLALLWYVWKTELCTPPIGLAIASGCNLLGFLLFLATQKGKIKFERSSIQNQLKKNWNFGKWLVGEQVITIISLYGSPWLLVLFLDSDAAGVFAACCSITGLVNPLMIGLGNYLLPKFSHEFANQTYSQRTYWYYMLLTFLVVGLFATCCAIWPDRLLRFFYPEDSYSGFGLILAILSIRTLIGSLGLISHYALLAMQRPKISLYASIICISVFLSASLILIPMFGLVGGAIAWSASAVAESLFMITAFQILMKSNQLSYLPKPVLSQN